MVIDIIPHKSRVATELEQTIMQIRGHSRLYYFERENGETSVHFSASELKDFVPNMTVSEFIETDTLTKSSQWIHAVSSINAGVHPVWYASTHYIKNTEWKRMEEWFSIATSLHFDYHKRSAAYIVRNAKDKVLHPWLFVEIINNY
jgi:hypothetical protein